MSTFEDKNYRWRETYFVLFDAKKRPKLKAVVKAMTSLNSRYELTNARHDDEGRIESLTIVSPDDYSALDICYLEGEEVLEQAPDIVSDLKKSAADDPIPIPYDDILKMEGRFDVLHFEHISNDAEEDEDDDMLDPGSLLIVLETLAKLTGGIAVDPQSGTVSSARRLIVFHQPFALHFQPPIPDFRLPIMIAKDIKRGHIMNYNGAPIIIEAINVQSPSARGAATLYKFRARNLISKQKVDLVLKGTDSLNEADFSRRAIKFMYSDPSDVYFLDQEDFNQYALPCADLEDELKYLTENLEGIQALIYNDQCVGIQLPLTVELKVTQCDPGIKGASATARTKPATLETGLVVQVPEYLAQGETVKVDTRTGEYLSRGVRKKIVDCGANRFTLSSFPVCIAAR